MKTSLLLLLVLGGAVKLERAILKPIVKVSRLKSSTDPIREHILFPFKKKELSKRDRGEPIIHWYNFGRIQGLDTSFGKKILFAPMACKPNFILYENEECTFCAGYYIKLVNIILIIFLC